MQARTGFGVTVGAVLTVLVLTVPAASAAPGAAASVANGPATTLWAYGALKTVSLSGKGSDGSGPYAYTINAYYGWQVILSQTNLTANVTEIEINRTVGLVFYASYCRPNCATPFADENVTITYHESGAGFANLTDAATVDEGATSVPAVGVINESAEDHSNYTRTTTAAIKGTSGTKTYDWVAATSTNGSAQLTFAPALGLFPSVLSNGSTWNASSAYTATGGWGLSASYVANPIFGSPVSLSGSASGSVNRSGTLGVYGADLGNVTLSNGATVQALAISVVGPFAIREGLLILPADAEALPTPTMGPGPSGITVPESYGNLSLVANAADIRPTGAGHFGLTASFAQFYGDSSAPEAPGMMTAANAPLNVAPASDSPGTVSVQAQPESVSQAQQGAHCLSAATCPLGSTTPNALRGAAVVVLALVIVAVLVAAVVVGRRRTEPAPPRAHPQFYAPVGAAPRAGNSPAPRPSPVGPEPDDPLDNLW